MFSRSVQAKTVERGSRRANVRFGRQAAGAAPYFSTEAYCHLKKQTNAPKANLCSTSSDDFTPKEDSSSCELHGSLCKTIDGASINKRTNEVMSRVAEKRHTSSSVIARLMGLDELHPQAVSGLKNENGHFLLEKSCAGLQEKSEFSGNHPFHISRRKRQNFKIVQDLFDSSKAKKHIDQVVQNEKKYLKPDITFIKQQFMEVKRLSTNETLQKSKEFNDALDILDSNKDIFFKFQQEPNYLFAKHFHDLKHSNSFCHTSHFKILESSVGNSRKNSETFYRTAEEVKGCPRKKKENAHGCTNPSSSLENCSAYDYEDSLLPKLLSSRYAGKRETSSQPISIVAMEPIVQKVQSRGKTESCLRPLQNYKSSWRRHREFHRELLVERKEQHQLFHVKTKGCKTKATKEIARDVSEQTKQSLRRHSTEMEVARIDIYNSSSTDLRESCQSKEAMNGLSKRWKMTEPSSQRQFGEDSSILGEMLSLSDQEVPQTLGQLIFKNLSDKIVDKENLHDSWAYTSGISSIDGGKDEWDTFLTRFEGHLNSSALYESSKSESNHPVGCFNSIDDFNTLKDMLNHENSDRNNSIRDMGHSLPRNFKNCDNNPHVFTSLGVENERPVKEVKVYKDASRNMINLNNLIEPKPIYLQRNMDDLLHLVHNCSKPKNLHPDKSFLSNLKEFQQSAKCKDLSVIVFENEVPEAASVDFPPVEFPLDVITQSRAFMAPKAAERLSPVSVLDTQSEDGKSAPECLERINSVLNDLRRQLNLLELETFDSGVEKSNSFFFNDEASREMLKILKHGGSRDFFYLLDILTVSGIYSSNQNKLFDACYLSDNPVFPDVFDKLEKKYNMVNSWPRSERKLLFDHINSVLAEVLAPCMDLHPWVKMRSVTSCGHDRLVNESWRILVRQQEELAKGRPEDKVLDTMWLYLDDHVDMIGREIEKMLKDDLLNELVSEFILG